MRFGQLLVASVLAVVSLLAGAQTVGVRGEQSASEKRNEQVVLDFYDKAINKKDFEAASALLGDRYIQHNPTAGDGHEGLKKFIEALRTRLPNYKSRIVSVFTDGDFVLLHVHNVREPSTRGFAIVDIFRLDKNGEIVQHWDVRQEIPDPATAANQNGMF
ncbi:nuclear transport factor 2 family protein [Rhizobacter sp. AJA081-3]|uniref:nuclear transport factor 2 family protein n=1 Tax=Rhizobacter sp. AJA081-3 TaxID=2753607 RepID=UPI001AE0B4F3|nr:nuclear transport factor 2 family protein [Rhizobacter sp. AJA081-3]QTN25732.1 nuclear transport factor 2 family protein [Rhizobacter sp. AJA081-3]